MILGRLFRRPSPPTTAPADRPPDETLIFAYTLRDETRYAFHVEGPRQLRTSAVWSAADATIHFYNSVGKKVHRVELVKRPRRLARPLQ